MTENELRQAAHVLAWVGERLQALPQAGPVAVQAGASCRLAGSIVKALAEQLGRSGELDDAGCTAALGRLRPKAPGAQDGARRPDAAATPRPTARASPAGSRGRPRKA